MFTGLASPAPATGHGTRWPTVRPTHEQEAAHTAAYSAYLAHLWPCAACMGDRECETGKGLRRALREAGR
ncbi:hypothetical protein [Streptomyces candidus]|uniref:Uncharacterized protein n=1 Tax=Streptomyces candidus TaxID=67283 RepID=A0A7X0LPX9_9ACTN|nr:hypothetical protein [Streptomyces candidus]MBB6437008.1 hypothetical protein [Streptomyces candidus]GHH32605.1 hypothetical protein GCM10018773_01910 [Streptomyces candidus]